MLHLSDMNGVPLKNKWKSQRISKKFKNRQTKSNKRSVKDEKYRVRSRKTYTKRKRQYVGSAMKKSEQYLAIKQYWFCHGRLHLYDYYYFDYYYGPGVSRDTIFYGRYFSECDHFNWCCIHHNDDVLGYIYVSEYFMKQCSKLKFPMKNKISSLDKIQKPKKKKKKKKNDKIIDRKDEYENMERNIYFKCYIEEIFCENQLIWSNIDIVDYNDILLKQFQRKIINNKYLNDDGLGMHFNDYPTLHPFTSIGYYQCDIKKRNDKILQYLYYLTQICFSSITLSEYIMPIWSGIKSNKSTKIKYSYYISQILYDIIGWIDIVGIIIPYLGYNQLHCIDCYGYFIDYNQIIMDIISNDNDEIDFNEINLDDLQKVFLKQFKYLNGNKICTNKIIREYQTVSKYFQKISEDCSSSDDSDHVEWISMW